MPDPDNKLSMTSLSLSKQEWGEFKGRYIGTVRFANNNGDVAINLDPDTSDTIIEIVAGQLITSASTVANLMREDIKRLTSTTPAKGPQLLDSQDENFPQRPI